MRKQRLLRDLTFYQVGLILARMYTVMNVVGNNGMETCMYVYSGPMEGIYSHELMRVTARRFNPGFTRQEIDEAIAVAADYVPTVAPNHYEHMVCADGVYDSETRKRIGGFTPDVVSCTKGQLIGFKPAELVFVGHEGWPKAVSAP